MSAKRLGISTLWLAIGGLSGVALLLWPWFTTIHPVWWIVALVVIAFAFNVFPNWWAETSSWAYFLGCWAVGSILTWLGGVLNQWLYVQNPSPVFPVMSTEWTWSVAVLSIFAWLIARSYLVVECYYNPEAFTVNAKKLWTSDSSEILVWLISILTMCVWTLLLSPLNHFTQSTTADRALYALIFAWVLVWLGKLAATLRAKSNPTVLHPLFHKALVEGQRWDDVARANKLY